MQTATEPREVAIAIGDCNACTGCVDLNPEIFGWDDNMDCPYLLKDMATEDEVQDVINCCPNDCIYFVDDDA